MKIIILNGNNPEVFLNIINLTKKAGVSAQLIHHPAKGIVESFLLINGKIEKYEETFDAPAEALCISLINYGDAIVRQVPSITEMDRANYYKLESMKIGGKANAT